MATMYEERKSIDISITCGKIKLSHIELDEQMTIVELDQIIHEKFYKDLPTNYRILAYDPIMSSFIDLKHQLSCERESNSSKRLLDLQKYANEAGSIECFIVDNSTNFNDYFKRNQHDQIVFKITSDILSNNSRIVTNPNYYMNVFNIIGGTSDNCAKSSPEKSLTSISTSVHVVESPTKECQSSNRLKFILDVKPYQRDTYRSDQFNIRQNKQNGRIPRIQGIKTEKQKMCQVLPKIKIPMQYRRSDIVIVVAIVVEKSQNNQRIWYKYPHKGFLPENFTKDTLTENPIEVFIRKDAITDTGEFALNLQMITKWNKSINNFEEYYRSYEQVVASLHSAQNEPDTPRLFCVLKENDNILWDTFCLSDFIRPAKHANNGESSNNPIQNDLELQRKRIRSDE